ncbi:MAG: hypothetical protein HN774_03740, partial [Bacteroidetes Order II. Incertae sedis bacterium]|nr:hypothetical protein [Bacteroidetes Order II. bacterium]
MAETPDKKETAAEEAMVSDIQPEGTQASASTVTSDDTTPSLEVPSPAGPSLLDQYTAHYPDWAKDFARKYFTKTLTQFIIYGNVRDLVAAGGDDGKSEYVSLH